MFTIFKFPEKNEVVNDHFIKNLVFLRYGKKKESGGRKGVDDDALCGDDDGSVVDATTMDDDGQRKIKTTQGKLVGRDYRGADGDGVTTINVKGRAVRIRNDDILNVSLPKAKREKGAK